MTHRAETNSSVDVVEKIGASVIQHGKSNDRIYLMKLSASDMPDITGKIVDMAAEKGYSKIFAKIPALYAPEFLNNGFEIEAFIPDFFNGLEDALFLAKYFTPSRRRKPADKLSWLSGFLMDFYSSPPEQPPRLDAGPEIIPLGEEHLGEMAQLYDEVFESYPFPIHKPEYLLETMRDNVYYFGIFSKGNLVGLSSSETDRSNLNTEMTDFAVHPSYRKQNLAYYLLRHMEKEMKSLGFKTAYTIARLNSPGMNKTFMKAAYKYSGTLINNTQISGSLESMNIWYKKL